MKRTVLVTGAGGFVGRPVVRALVANGCPVRAVVRAGRESAVDSIAGVESVLSSPDLFQESTDWWNSACNGVDSVIHLAWYAEPGKYLSSPRNLECLEGTLRLARACVAQKLRRFVGIGTCFEYDLRAGYVSADTPLLPNTLYAATKAATWLTLKQLFADAGVEFAWARLFYLYGEGEDPRRLVPYVRAQLATGQPAELTAGMQVRDYLDVAVAGRMIADIAGGSRQGAMNVASGQGVTVREMVERIADEYGRRDLLRFGARQENAVDPPCVVGVDGGAGS